MGIGSLFYLYIFGRLFGSWVIEDSAIILDVSSNDIPTLTIAVLGLNEFLYEWGLEFVPVLRDLTGEAEPVNLPHVPNYRLAKAKGAGNYHFWSTASSEIP